jgi:hypothetical protein
MPSSSSITPCSSAPCKIWENQRISGGKQDAVQNLPMCLSQRLTRAATTALAACLHAVLEAFAAVELVQQH